MHMENKRQSGCWRGCHGSEGTVSNRLPGTSPVASGYICMHRMALAGAVETGRVPPVNEGLKEL